MSLSLLAPAHVQAAALRRREIGAEEWLREHLDRIARLNPVLNAVVTLDPDGAIARARAADAALARGELWGPLHGVPVTLKDGHAVRGMRTTAGYEKLADYVPDEDGTVAARLRAAGAVIMGKTNVARLLADIQCDNPVFGRTNNPWDPARTPGGSSGGACVAVATGMAALEIGSDIGGSVRIPAHFCGVYGLKPTEGRASIIGHIPDLPANPRGIRVMGVMGPQARDLDDLALGLRLIAGPDGRDTGVPPVPLVPEPVPDLRDLRIAWAPTFPEVPVAADIRAALEGLAAGLDRAGAKVAETLPVLDFAAQRQLFSDLVVMVIRVFGPARAGQPPFTMAAYLEALHRRDGFIRAWEDFFADWDALLCPVAMTTAFPHCATDTPILVDGTEARYWQSIGHCCPFNLTGHPSLALPVGQDRAGLPIGVQLVGRRWGEERLLAIAKALAPLTPGFRPPPDYA